MNECREIINMTKPSLGISTLKVPPEFLPQNSLVISPLEISHRTFPPYVRQVADIFACRHVYLNNVRFNYPASRRESTFHHSSFYYLGKLTFFSSFQLLFKELCFQLSIL